MSARKLQKITKPGMYATGTRTLYQRIAPGGSRQWVQRLTIYGKRHHIGLGPVGAVTLAAASRAATINLAKTYQGIDVIAERREAQRAASVPTFGQTMAAVLDTQGHRWTTAASRRKWTRILENHGAALMGERVDRITTKAVLATIIAAHRKAPDSARRLRQSLKVVFAYAEAQGHISRNPAGEAIDGAVPTRKQAQHFEALAYADVPAMFRKLDDQPNRPAALLLKVVALTAVRATEARGATWDEFDLEARLWTIPASRMKGRREHVVPLSDPALDALREAEALRDTSALVFPSAAKAGAMISAAFLLKVFKDASGGAGTVHGLRSGFRSWAAEAKQNRAAAEQCLAHRVGSATEQAYQRSALIEQRRSIMARWAGLVTGQHATVVALRA